MTVYKIHLLWKIFATSPKAKFSFESLENKLI